MSSSTATVKPTNRFLEVTQRFATRLPGTHKRSRPEAVAHLSANVSTVLLMDGKPRYKRRILDIVETKCEQSNNRLVGEEAKDEKQVVAIEDNVGEKNETSDPTVQLLQNSSKFHDGTLVEQEIRRQKEELITIEKDIVAIENTKKLVLQEVVDVVGAYQYGLNKISTLTDLSAAPDAIMPGNF
jgi:hypothetical protein